MEQALELQRELLAVVQLCVSAPPPARPTFGQLGSRLRALLKRAAKVGLDGAGAALTPRLLGGSVNGGARGPASSAVFTPRTSCTEYSFTPRAPL